MSKKICHHNLIFHINYDPIEELYYCGIPGYSAPTIYVEKTEKKVQESTEDLLNDYLDFCSDQGTCHETEIAYDVQEAYSTGWIVRETGSQTKDSSFKKQLTTHIENKSIENFMDNITENHPNFSEVKEAHDSLKKIEEEIANLAENKQHARMKLIDMAQKTGKSKVRGYGVEVLKVERLGVQKSN